MSHFRANTHRSVPRVNTESLVIYFAPTVYFHMSNNRIYFIVYNHSVNLVYLSVDMLVKPSLDDLMIASLIGLVETVLELAHRRSVHDRLK